MPGHWASDRHVNNAVLQLQTPPPPHHNRFMALFPGPPGWASARRELLDFMVQGKINRGRHTDHPARRHSIWTNQCPPPPSPHFLQAGCPSCRPTNSVKALKANSATNTHIQTLTSYTENHNQTSYHARQHCTSKDKQLAWINLHDANSITAHYYISRES